MTFEQLSLQQIFSATSHSSDSSATSDWRGGRAWEGGLVTVRNPGRVWNWAGVIRGLNTKKHVVLWLTKSFRHDRLDKQFLFFFGGGLTWRFFLDNINSKQRFLCDFHVLTTSFLCHLNFNDHWNNQWRMKNRCNDIVQQSSHVHILIISDYGFLHQGINTLLTMVHSTYQCIEFPNSITFYLLLWMWLQSGIHHPIGNPSWEQNIHESLDSLPFWDDIQQLHANRTNPWMQHEETRDPYF